MNFQLNIIFFVVYIYLYTLALRYMKSNSYSPRTKSAPIDK